MDATVQATIGQQLYLTEIKTASHALIADEPLAQGGGNMGMNPMELLASALASCTAITLKMYMSRKQWIVDQVQVEVNVVQDEVTKQTIFDRVIVFVGGNLTAQNKDRLLLIADKCPIHKVLMGDNKISTILK